MLNPSEAVYGFASWLTTRRKKITISSQNDASIIAKLVDDFCKINKLKNPRDNWTDDLLHPKED